MYNQCFYETRSSVSVRVNFRIAKMLTLAVFGALGGTCRVVAVHVFVLLYSFVLSVIHNINIRNVSGKVTCTLPTLAKVR